MARRKMTALVGAVSLTVSVSSALRKLGLRDRIQLALTFTDRRAPGRA